jgi:hypothetical protein
MANAYVQYIQQPRLENPSKITNIQNVDGKDLLKYIEDLYKCK